jgi:hypothetical protein
VLEDEKAAREYHRHPASHDEHKKGHAPTTRLHCAAHRRIDGEFRIRSVRIHEGAERHGTVNDNQDMPTFRHYSKKYTK